MRGAGEYRHRVSIKARVETKSGTNAAMTETWPTTTRSRKSALVRPLSGRELERAQATDGRITHEVRFPFWRDYRTDMKGGRARLVYHDGPTDRTFEAVTPPVDVEERRTEVMVQCRELVTTT